MRQSLYGNNTDNIPPRFDSKCSAPIEVEREENYRKISKEEIERYKEFTKNFVFSGNQFLYVN
jgi:hypothetical protein